MNHEPLDVGLPGDIVSFHFKNLTLKDAGRGMVASNTKDNPAAAVIR